MKLPPRPSSLYTVEDNLYSLNQQLTTIHDTLTAIYSEKPLFKARKTLNQSIPNVLDTPVTWDIVDLNEQFVLQNGSQIRVTQPSWYQINYTVAFSNAAGTLRYAYLAKNAVITGTNSRSGSVTVTPLGGPETIISSSALLNLSLGDTLQLYVYQDSGGALNIQGNQTVECAITVRAVL